MTLTVAAKRNSRESTDEILPNIDESPKPLQDEFALRHFIEIQAAYLHKSSWLEQANWLDSDHCRF